MSDSDFENAVDPIMESLDRNKDGYIDYGEYRLSMKKT